MANRVPFTAYFKIVPDRGNGKRFEIQRSRERIARLIWGDIEAAGPTINQALPGGGITWGLASSADSLSDMMQAVAVKPQFGEFPDTATLVGFYEMPSADFIPYKQMTLISGGAVHTGPATGARGYHPSTEPSTDCDDLAKALRTALVGAITSVTVDLIKLEVAGVTYGHGGRHFPQ